MATEKPNLKKMVKNLQAEICKQCHATDTCDHSRALNCEFHKLTNQLYSRVPPRET